MKQLVIIYLALFCHTALASPPLKVRKADKVLEITPKTELGELVHKFDLNKSAIKAVEATSLAISFDNKFAETPFLYFFNGLIPKDRNDPRIWKFESHYMKIESLGNIIMVNNLYPCTSLKLAESNDHLICLNDGETRNINFDGTSRDYNSTGDICNIKGDRSLTYGNCVIKIDKNNLRCRIRMTWPLSNVGQITKSCQSIEIIGEKIHCRRKKLKNNEFIDISPYCLTDSSVILDPGVFDGRRDQVKSLLESQGFQGKEPPSETKSK